MFELAVFADDISQDLAHSLDVAQNLGVNWVEIRSAWGKNLVDHNEETVRKVADIIHDRGLHVPSVSAPIYKSRLAGRGEASAQLFGAQERDDLAEQLALIPKAAQIGRLFGTTLVRCFSFWLIEGDLAPYWGDIRQALASAAKIAASEGIVLVMENDFECNLGSGVLAAQMIEEIDSPNLRLLWDPGNARFVGETPFPDGYKRGKHLIGHVHVKDAVLDKETGEPRWVSLGTGEVDLLGQLRALKKDGYAGVVSMENHFTPAGGDTEAGVRESFAGLQRLMAQV